MRGYSGFLPQFKDMPVRLIGLSKLLLGVLPCDGLATCPGCTTPPAHRLLEIGTSFPVTHYGRSVLPLMTEYWGDLDEKKEEEECSVVYL
ncbi:hypothetical protein ILYODFUR_023596 [Ilyodon furcidens]|uniref:Uncharacterized protein n=1 Tax=Ilyodon furcidens TaxID=33524 RepID=A0ABV0SNP8_9TELE